MKNRKKGTSCCYFSSRKKDEKNWKKQLTIRGQSDIISKRSTRGTNPWTERGFPNQKRAWMREQKTTWRCEKKFLTSELRYGKLIKSPVRAANKGEACRADLRAEKVWKNFKKSSWQGRNGVVKWTPAAAKRCVPCKLNNVTNTKHQIGFGCSNKLSLKDNR